MSACSLIIVIIYSLRILLGPLYWILWCLQFRQYYVKYWTKLMDSRLLWSAHTRWHMLVFTCHTMMLLIFIKVLGLLEGVSLSRTWKWREGMIMEHTSQYWTSVALYLSYYAMATPCISTVSQCHKGYIWDTVPLMAKYNTLEVTYWQWKLNLMLYCFTLNCIARTRHQELLQFTSLLRMSSCQRLVIVHSTQVTSPLRVPTH